MRRPAYYHPLYVNAYVQPSAKCVVMLGMARRPWADVDYDDVSLLSRWGYIVAHELAHLALNTGYATGIETGLLQRTSRARSTSRSRTLALLALMHHPTLQAHTDGAAELCAHLSQSCARAPPLYDLCRWARTRAPTRRLRLQDARQRGVR